MAIPWLEGINTAANVASTIGSFFGGGGAEGLSRDDQRFLAHQAQVQQARDNFVQENFMQIRARDAEKAGLHPLAALGVMPTAGGSAPTAMFQSQKGPNWGDRLNAMGQNLSRAISAYQTSDQKRMFEVELENKKKEGNLIDQNIAESMWRMANQPGTPPPSPKEVSGPKPKYVAYQLPDGSIEMAYNPEYAASLMSDPWQMHAQSIRGIASSAQTGGFPWQGLWNEIKAGARRLNPFKWGKK